MRTRAATFHVACVLAAVIGAGLAGAAPASQHRLPDPNTWVPGGTPTVPAGPSPVVYPPQRLPLVFSHAKHAARGTTCTECHAAALTSTASKDLILPGEATCARCHPIDRAQPTRAVAGKPPAACTACHPGWTTDAPVERIHLPAPNLIFDHAAHAATPCATCHGDVTTLDLATRDALPMMATCLTCHDGSTPGAAAACTTCHPAEPTGRIRTALPDGVLAPRSALLGDAHDPGFARHHATAARSPDATCASCHADHECADCHAGVAKPYQYHPGDYAQSHSIEARRGVPDCTVCHRQATFCVGCHERSGVGARGETDFAPGDDARNFHPAGWADRPHARAAKRNLDTCASCHRDDFCTTCHSAEPSAPKVSPHPPGWRNSARCKSLDKRNRRMCLRCHISSAELGCAWSP
jgi:hypothetical protein